MAQPLDTRTADCASDVTEHLANFGVPKSKRGARNHVVLSAPSRPKTGRETAIQNLAPDAWRPQNVCTLTMDRALREMEFPSRLAGAEWTLE